MAFWPELKLKTYRAAGRALARYMRFVKRTSAVVIEPHNAHALVEGNHPFILAMWHGQFMLMPTLDEGNFRVSAIVARHSDAEVVGALLGEFNMAIVRGAGAGTRKRDRGGAYALRSALRVLKDGSTFSMTADVPPGPARKSGAGIVTLSRLSGRPIIPFATATSRYIALPSWSRMTINLPYSKLAYVTGDPIFVPPDITEADIPRYQAMVEAGLDRVTARAYELAGADMRRATPPKPLDETSPVAPLGVTYSLYRLLTGIFRPFAPLMLAVRRAQGKEDPARIGERYGLSARSRPQGPLVWFHAASVGETNAILPVIDRLLAERADLSVLVTTGTMTSATMVMQAARERLIHQFVPLDVATFVRRFLAHWQPTVAVFTESEIWPNLIVEAEARGVPLVLVNGRMSPRSLARWRRMKGSAASLFTRFSLILTQNEGFGRYFKELGGRKVRTLGNLKVDAPPPPVQAAARDALAAAIAGRPVFVAASTHDAEDLIVAAAHRAMSAEIPGLITIIAPRHPSRGDAIASALRDADFRVLQRSKGQLPEARTDIYIADTIGELGTLYSLAGVAFIGGSLIPHGGQNPIEAIGHGVPVLTGPNWQNFRDFYPALMRHRGAIEVASAEDLAREAQRILKDPAERERMQAGGKTAVMSLSGALKGTVEELLALLPPQAGGGARGAA